jgi:multiple sugar transport system substrate-binding protein
MTAWWAFIQSDYQAKHPGIKLQTEFLSDFTVYQTRFAGGTYPDAMHTSTAFTYDFWLRGALATLESRIAQTPMVSMDQFMPTSLFYNQAQGHIFGIPMEGPDSEAFIYNTDMFTTAGLDPDPAKVSQWTWDQFTQAARSLTKLDGSGNVTVAGFDGPALALSITGLSRWLNTNGVDLYNQQINGVAFDNAQGIETVQFLVDLSQKYKFWWPSNVPPTKNGRVLDGVAATAITGTWNVETISDFAPKLNYQIVPLPAGPHGKPSTRTWENMVALPKQAKNPDAGWDFMAYYAGKDTIIQRLAKLNRVGPRLDFFQSPEFIARAKTQPQITWVQKVGEVGGRDAYFRQAALTTAVQPIIKQALAGTVSAADATHQMAQACNAVLAQPE